MKRGLVMTIASVLALSACTSATTDTAPESPSTASDGAAESAAPSPSGSASPSSAADATQVRADAAEGRIERLWTWEGRPVSLVNHEGDRALFYALGSKGWEQLIALDAFTGEQAWAKSRVARTMRPITDVYFTAQFNRAPVVIDDTVYFAQQQGARRGKEFVVGVDLQTGEERVRSTPSPGAIGGVFSCGEDDALVPCFDAWDKNDERQTYELKPDGTWRLYKSTSDGVEMNWDTDSIDVKEAGKTRLSVPLKKLVGAAPVKGTYGMSVGTVEVDGREIGIASVKPIPKKAITSAGTITRIDYDSAITVGFDPESGDRLWRRDGVGYCPSSPSQSLNPADEDSPEALIRCAMTGTVYGGFYRANAPLTSRLSEDFSVDLLRLDPLTGEDIWSVELGRNRMVGVTPQSEVGGTTLLSASDTEDGFPVDDGASTTVDIVDLITGETRKATASSRFICYQPEYATTASAWYVKNVADKTLVHWTSYPCSWPGRRADDGDFRAALLSANPEVEAPYFFVEKGSVTAYDWAKVPTS